MRSLGQSQGVGFRGSGFRVQDGLGFRCSGFRVQGVGVEGLVV